MELHAHFYACRGAALHQCCADAEAGAVADAEADADTVQTPCRLGLVARFFDDTLYQKAAKSAVTAIVGMLLQDYDKAGSCTNFASALLQQIPVSDEFRNTQR